MIKLDEHVVVINEKQYVPVEIAVQAVVEALSASKNLSETLNDISNRKND